jgi:hypothetical protein
MPKQYDPDYYRRYAQSDKGRAARQRARARWLQKRKAQRPQFEAAPLTEALKGWQ